MKIQKPTPGRIIEVAIADENGAVVAQRAAVITSVWDDSGNVNCRVFLDGTNDEDLLDTERVRVEDMETLWLGTVEHNSEGKISKGQAASWHYPPRVTEEIDVPA